MGYNLLLFAIFTLTSVLYYTEHSLKDHPWLAIKRKLCSASPKPYPFVLLKRTHFVLFVFPCVFKEEEYRSTSHFPHKISPTNSAEFQMLGCKSGFSKMSRWFQQPYLNKAYTYFYLNLLEKFWLKTSKWKSNLTVYSIRQLIWWLQLNMWSPYGILSPILSPYII